MKLSVSKNSSFLYSVNTEEYTSQDYELVEEIYVGRSPDCQIVLDDHKISRYHLTLIRKNRNWFVQLTSVHSEKIKINGVSCEGETLLKVGDVVSIYSYHIKIDEIEIMAMPSSPGQQDSNKPIDNSSSADASPPLGAQNKSGGPVPSSEKGKLGTSGLSMGDQVQLGDPKEKEDEHAENDLESSEASKNLDQDQKSGEGDSSLDFDNEEKSSSTSEGQDSFSLSGMDSSFGSGDDKNKSEEQGQESSFEDSQKNEGSEEGGVGSEQTAEGDQEQNQDQGGGDEGTNVIRSFFEYYLEIVGEYAPYDKYSIVENVVYIGRDNRKCQIVLTDPEVSQVHAKLERKGAYLVLTDLNSSNGTLLNGLKINQERINKDDEFVIGSTSFKLNIVSELMNVEKDSLMPVEENQQIEVQEIVEEEVSFEDASTPKALGLDEKGSGNQSLFSKEALKDPVRRKKLLIIAVVLMGLWVLLEEEPQDNTKKDKGTATKKATKSEKTDEQVAAKKVAAKELTPEEKEFVAATYELAKKYFEDNDYENALFELDKIYSISAAGYKQSDQIKSLALSALKKIKEAEEKKKLAMEEEKRVKEIDEKVKKAQEAVKDKNFALAKTIFTQIFQIDPENADVSVMKLEIEEIERKKNEEAVQKAQEEARRMGMVNIFTPGKLLYIEENWYKAISKLEEILRTKDLDQDLREEATKMLVDSHKKLKEKVKPLLEKAQELKEGQDLKGSYQKFLEVLKIDPSDVASLNAINEISVDLDSKAKKVYREAIISESLSLFDQAKEKFEEVKQIAPIESEYYIKASKRLEKYLY